MPEQAAAFYFVQLLRAVLHVHEAGFCHRDIKARGRGFCLGGGARGPGRRLGRGFARAPRRACGARWLASSHQPKLTDLSQSLPSPPPRP
jgi:serine/threonine protein kinase